MDVESPGRQGARRENTGSIRPTSNAARRDESAPRSHRLFMDRPSLHEGPQSLAPAGVAQLPERLRLDLADPLPCHLEILTHLLEGVIGFLADPEPHPE